MFAVILFNLECSSDGGHRCTLFACRQHEYNYTYHASSCHTDIPSACLVSMGTLITLVRCAQKGHFYIMYIHYTDPCMYDSILLPFDIFTYMVYCTVDWSVLHVYIWHQECTYTPDGIQEVDLSVRPL